MSRSLLLFLIIIIIPDHSSFYHAVLVIDLIPLIRLPWFVYLHLVFLADGHLETSDKAISYGIFRLFQNPFCASIWSQKVC
jgi:hypothetical protein